MIPGKKYREKAVEIADNLFPMIDVTRPADSKLENLNDPVSYGIQG